MLPWVAAVVLAACGGGGGGGSAGPDTQAPTVPTGVAVHSNSSTSNTVSWQASTDDVGVTGYKLYRDGTLVGTSATTAYEDAGLMASSAYSYRVAAYDAAANVSAKSTAVSVTTLAQLVPAARSLGVFVAGWHWGLEYWSEANDDDLIQSARDLGIGVIHLFLPPFETTLGVYDEAELVKLDHFLSSASDRGMYVMISFINIYGDAAVQTANAYYNPSGIEGLMTEPLKSALKNRISMLMNRTNTYDGKVYKDDPTIAAWIVGDEPISAPNNYPTGEAPNVTVAAFAAWLEEMAGYIKGIDPTGAVSIFIQGAQSTLTDGDWTASVDVPSVDFVYAEDADMRVLNHFDANAAADWSQRLFEIGKPVIAQLAFTSGAWDSSLCTDYTTQAQLIHDGATGYFELGAQSVIVQNWGTDLYATAIPSFARCYTYTDSNTAISSALSSVAAYINP